MSIKDPLLTELKGLLLKLKGSKRAINDSHPETFQLFMALEQIFRKGLKSANTVFGLARKDYWRWIEGLEQHLTVGRPNPMLSLTLEAVKQCKKVRTFQGKGRLFIRIALNKGILGLPIDLMTRNSELLETWYDPHESIIGNELLVESLTSLLFWASEIKFDFNIKNASFLDETWVLPLYHQFELVPCQSLGIIVRHIWERIIVAEVKPGSVAADENRIEAGDVLDELYGESLYATVRGKIPKLLSDHEGWPIYISIVKCRLRSGMVFPPLKEKFHQMMKEYPGFVEPKDRSSNGDWSGSIQGHELEDEPPMESLSGSSFHKVQYIGKVPTGEDGGTDVIEGAIKDILLHHDDGRKEVILELGETLVIVRDAQTKEEIMKNCYPEISSCGRRMDHFNCFAFVVGDTTCSISRSFQCYLFEARTEIESRQILQSIAQGFGRTVDCV